MSDETSTQKLVAWAREERKIKELQLANDKLKLEIEASVFLSGEELRLPDGLKCIITSKGSFDWENIAKTLEPDDETITKNTEIHWNKVAEETEPDEKKLKIIKDRFYVAGTKFAQCRIK